MKLRPIEWLIPKTHNLQLQSEALDKVSDRVTASSILESKRECKFSGDCWTQRSKILGHMGSISIFVGVLPCAKIYTHSGVVKRSQVLAAYYTADGAARFFKIRTQQSKDPMPNVPLKKAPTAMGRCCSLSFLSDPNQAKRSL
ncbi:uncharacterized protein LOC109827741 isoform X3 [Asparagus officinalis]|uniref:uncharacterized protein LOC109827741 isoform X3 n=1 Tax=Asparagus officinalis TaxID=4686 RepID=UPI00098E5ABB|nr:uncharacterized protein LOC109827741 isoform X3 [Asparagus officinalis]